MPLKQSLGATPHGVWQTAGRTWQGFHSQEQREITSYGGTYIRLTHQLPGKPEEGMPLTASLMRTIASRGLGQVWRKVSPVHKIQVQQALVGQWVDR